MALSDILDFGTDAADFVSTDNSFNMMDTVDWSGTTAADPSILDSGSTGGWSLGDLFSTDTLGSTLTTLTDLAGFYQGITGKDAGKLTSSPLYRSKQPKPATTSGGWFTQFLRWLFGVK